MTHVDDDMENDMDTLLDLHVVRAQPTLAVRAVAAGDGEAPADGRLATLVVDFSRFDTWYEIDSWLEGRFMERTVKGAFKRTIKNDGPSVKTLFDHGFDPQIGNKILGRWEVLEERDDSPHMEVPLLDTSYNRDLLPGLEVGGYGSSFRMRVTKDQWDDEPGASDHNPNGLPERTITQVRLYEAGPVTWPANPDATSGVRSMTDDFYRKLRDREPDKWDELCDRAHMLRSRRTHDPHDAPPTGHSSTPDAPPLRSEEHPPEDVDAPPSEEHPSPAAARPELRELIRLRASRLRPIVDIALHKDLP